MHIVNNPLVSQVLHFFTKNCPFNADHPLTNRVTGVFEDFKQMYAIGAFS